MKRSKFTEEQIAFALKQAEVGTPVELPTSTSLMAQTVYCSRFDRSPTPGHASMTVGMHSCAVYARRRRRR